MGESGPVHPDSTKVRLSGAAASTCHDDFTPGGSGIRTRNFPVFASCTLGRTGVKVAVFEFARMNRAIGVLAITMERGRPVGGNGEPVASGV